MKKRLIKPISFDSRHFQIGNIFYKENNKWYIQSNRENDVVPSYININDKEYFEDFIETKFKLNDLIIYKHKVYKLIKINQYDYINGYNYNSFNIEHVDNKLDRIKLTEQEINKCSETKEYFFIDSKGKIQKSYLGLNLSADTFRIKVNNIFQYIEDARKQLQELMK